MTTSWAQRAAAAAAAPAPTSTPAVVVAGGGGSGGGKSSTSAADVDARPPSSLDTNRYVVLDTNALLLSGNGGVGLSRYAKIGGARAREGEEDDSTSTTQATLLTTRAALAEVRDAASREALERLRGTGVCELVLREPEEEDVRAVLAFARETGELHSISSTDARLIALARGLERSAGRAHLLRAKPPPPRSVRKGGPRARPPPGWGSVGGGWAPLDALEEEEERAAREAIGGEETGEEAEKAEAPATPAQEETAAAGGESDGGSDDDEGEGEDDGWTTAAKSQAAQRRQRRSAARRSRREAAVAAAAAAAGEEDEGGWETASDDDDDGDGAPVSTAPATDEQGEDPAADSPVSLVTADFAMQNVALQMGLRVVSPSNPRSSPSTTNDDGDGLRVRQVRRWALRCSACSRVCREPGRLFCPGCGNATLDKVEVVVDFATGVSTFGVRKNHCLRGTKFSLPKPRGGRGGSGPILREDQLLEAMARARRRGGAKKRGGGDGDDPLLAPELSTADAWFKASSSSSSNSATAALGGATAALVAATWKHNPNEARRWGGGVRAAGSAGKRK